jgi:NAD(P)-dependent dehydrogenase (short-subunit alcohol dehydrogenase family)
VDLGLGQKVVLVTGGSDGLGRALCQGLVAEGARVAFCGRDQSRLDATLGALTSSGGDALAVQADVTEPEDLSRFVDSAVTRWGRIDGIVNNAGAGAAKPLSVTLDADWDEDLRLKLYGALRLVRFALPHLEAQGGSIVNTLAISAKAPGAASAPSSVSRAAGMAMTKALSKELGPSGVRVNAVLIGMIESGQWERLAGAQGKAVGTLYRELAEGAAIPLGRVGRAEEFADLVSYLLSERSSYLTGTAINLDGGLSPVV